MNNRIPPEPTPEPSNPEQLDHYLLQESENAARILFNEHGQIASPICIAWKGTVRAALMVLPWSKEPEEKSRVMTMVKDFVALHEITAVTFVIEAWVRKYAKLPEGYPAGSSKLSPLPEGSSILMVSVCQRGRPTLGTAIPIAEDRTLEPKSMLTTSNGLIAKGWFAEIFSDSATPAPPDPSRN
jgi:hypothetical protein